jgi:hypothetical protein
MEVPVYQRVTTPRELHMRYVEFYIDIAAAPVELCCNWVVGF